MAHLCQWWWWHNQKLTSMSFLNGTESGHTGHSRFSQITLPPFAQSLHGRFPDLPDQNLQKDEPSPEVRGPFMNTIS